MSIFEVISNAFLSGGIWMWTILAVQIVTFAIIFERIVSLFVFRQVGEKKTAEQFEGLIKSGDLKSTQEKSSRIANSHPVANVIRAGTQAAIDMGGKEDIQSRMDEVLLDENSKIERRTGLLAMLGNVATLLGLLGTIVGMIQAFASVSNEDAIEKAALLTKGISMAMNTTAYGLIVAIPALVMYALLQNRSNRLMDDLNQGALRAYNWLSFHYDYVPKRTTR